MASKIVLISDDVDFFEFLRSKLAIRRSDELFAFSFDQVEEKFALLSTAVLIVNSENAKEKTLNLLKVFKGTPIIVSAYNEDEEFRLECYRAGMFDYITILTPDKEFQSRLIPALSISALLEKNQQYREVLVKNKIISETSEVFLDYNYIIDRELEFIHSGSKKAVIAAISPDERDKFLVQPELIEKIILKNIRKNDILMNYAPNKYFLLLFDLDTEGAKRVWEKILEELPQKFYAGFSNISNQKREHLINEVLNRLHCAINNKVEDARPNPVAGLSGEYTNFKQFRKEFGRKIEQIITPVFYSMQQKYSGKLAGITLQQGSGEGYGTFYIKGKYTSSCFRITSPGFSKINIDITYQRDSENVDAKRITLEPEELEAGLLEDLLEQFIMEYKRGEGNDF